MLKLHNSRRQAASKKVRPALTRLQLELLEDRNMLDVAAGQYLIHISGLPGNTRAVQEAAAQQLLNQYADPSANATVIDHLGADGVLVIKASLNSSLTGLTSQLNRVPGLNDVELWDPDAAPSAYKFIFPASPGQEGDGGSGGGSSTTSAPVNVPAGPLFNTGSGFNGISANANAAPIRPPDSDGAVGPNTFINAVNSNIAIYDKTTGNPIVGGGITSYPTFFASLGAVSATGDPTVVYNDITGKFFVSQLDSNLSSTMFLDVAISKTSNPTLNASDWNFFKYNVNDGTGGFDFADYPKLGYNADGYVVSFNMFPNLGSFDHVSTISINNSGVSTGIVQVPGGFTNFTLAPASEHGAAAGAPMWFVEDGHGGGGGGTITVVEMTSVFNAVPVFTPTVLNVNAYSNAATPRQPGGVMGGKANLGTRFYFSDLRTVGGVTHLVTADPVGANGGVEARWYDLNVTNPLSPTVIQQGNISRGNDGGGFHIDTYLPSAAIDPNGNIGMTFSESSSTEFLSMYDTLRLTGDPLNTMEAPVLAKAGTANLGNGGDRVGDYSMTSIDPVNGSFWAVSEYGVVTTQFPNWGTWIQNFSPPGVGNSGTFTPLNNLAPAGTGTMFLLTDGTVAVNGGNASNFYRLTPDGSGSYINGAWSNLASMSTPRLYYGSNILPNGNLFVVGGEYSGVGLPRTDTNTGEIYNPLTNTWTPIATFPQPFFGDDPTMVLSNGLILAGYERGPQTYLYDPAANTWTATGNKLRNDQSDEESWVKLPDGSVLSYDVFSSISLGVGHAQRYIPATGTWVDAGIVPVPLSSPADGYELGPAFLLPDGRVFQIGANGNTAIYTPGTNSWVAGPVIPGGLGADDAPGAVLPNGHVIFAADTPLFNGPTTLLDFDPVANTITPVTGLPPSFLSGPSFIERMLVLPNGDVLLSNSSNQLYELTPAGAPQNAWRPTVTSVVPNGVGQYTLTGTQLNGLSEGSAYGDDVSNSTNYPIVQLSSGSNVYYARTFGWVSQVATGATAETTQFTLPAGLPFGSYTLKVIANGIASTGVQFNLSAPFTFVPVNPLGSLVYVGSTTDNIASAGNTNSLSFSINPGQTMAVVVTPTDPTLNPTFQILDAANNVVGGATGAAPGSPALQQVFSAAGGKYTINITGASSTTGHYSLNVYLNAAIESGDNGGSSNNTLGTAQDLTGSFETVTASLGSATRADVVGILTGGTATINAADSGHYDSTGFHSSGNKNYVSGEQFGNFWNDYFVFDLSSLAAGTVISGAQLKLSNPGSTSPNSSDTWSLFDVSTSIATLEASNSGQTGIYNDLGSGTSYGSNTLNFNGGSDPVSTTLNAAGVAALNGAVGSQFAVGGDVTTKSGSNSDQNFIYGFSGGGTRQLLLTTNEVDYYKFTAAAGDNITLAMKELVGSGATIQLLNSGGGVLASGVAGSTNLDQVISNFAVTAAGTYYIKVTGSNGQYNLVLTKNASFDTEPNDTVAQAQDITATRAALGAITTGVPAGIKVGYYTDFDTFNTTPATPITQAGYTPVQITTLTGFNLNTINMLMIDESNNGQPSSDVTNELPAIQAWVQAGGILITHDRGVDSDPSVAGADPFLLGAPNAVPHTDFTSDLNVVPPGGTLVTNGPFGTITDSTLDGGSSSAHGYIDAGSLPAGTTDILYNNTAGGVGNAPNPNLSQVAALSYQLGAGTVYYSTIPLDYYLDGNNPAAFRTIYAPNMLTYAASFVSATNPDYYKVTLSAAQNTLEIATSTPSDGANVFNNTLNPHLQLLDASGNPVPANQVQLTIAADGRNELLVATGLTPGATYVIAVTSEGGTKGEYFIDAKSFAKTGLPIRVDDNNANNNASNGSGNFQLTGKNNLSNFGWTTVSNPAAFDGSERIHAGDNSDTADATWTYSTPATTTVTSYTIYASWVAAPGNATNATYKIYIDGVLKKTAVVDQTQSPGTAVLGNTLIQSLFTVALSAGSHSVKVVLSDIANGTVVADGIFDPPDGGGDSAGDASMVQAGEPGLTSQPTANLAAMDSPATSALVLMSAPPVTLAPSLGGATAAASNGATVDSFFMALFHSALEGRFDAQASGLDSVAQASRQLNASPMDGVTPHRFFDTPVVASKADGSTDVATLDRVFAVTGAEQNTDLASQAELVDTPLLDDVASDAAF